MSKLNDVNFSLLSASVKEFKRCMKDHCDAFAKDDRENLDIMNQEAYAKARKSLANRYGTKIVSERYAFVNKLEKIKNNMESLLKTHVETVPSSVFVTLLSFYKQFNIPMSKIEIENMNRLAGGAYVATAALAEVAKESGYAVSYVSAADLVKDLEAIDKVISVTKQYLPDGLEHDNRCSLNAGVDIIAESYARSVIDKFEKSGITEITERWNSAAVPAVTINENGSVSVDTGKAASIEINQSDSPADGVLAADAESMAQSKAAQDYYFK